MVDPRLGWAWNGRRWRDVLAIAAMAGALAAAAPPPLGVVAQVQELNAELLGTDSASATLAAWCAERRLASPPVIFARKLAVTKPADAQVRALLQAGPDEPVAYRRVELVCGSRVLSVADNWYRPRQLTPEMNQALAGANAPFGQVVQPLGFHRQNLEATVLVTERELVTPRTVLRHRALLQTADGTPFSYVVEAYTREVLAAP
jgi:hypothetical protein